MADTISFHLPENLTIASVHGLHEELEVLVSQSDCDKVVLQASDVQRADTAGVQLLLAFVNASKEHQIGVEWDKPSDKLCTTAELLGLQGALGIH